MKLSEIKTAEELMRARYHAYETCDMEFIKESHDPDNTDGIDWAECEKWARESQSVSYTHLRAHETVY